ncbi:hypothetical protein JCM10207_007251 [Rhodosporidiobolus poonsookiae]
MSTIEHHPDPEKGVKHHGEDKPQTTLQEDVAAYGLEKVYERHGRIDLVPLPSDDPQDPLNWPAWRKNLVLVQVAFAAMMGPFSAAATIPAFEQFVEEWGISITLASYTVSIVIIFIGCFPLLWAPISNRIGRRPVLLISFIVSAAMHLAGAYTNSYGSFMTVRVFQGIFLAPAQSIGSNMCREMYFQHEMGQKLGIWTLLTSLGPPVAPFIMGFVVFNTGRWQAILYTLAGVNLVQFLAFIALGPETMYDRPDRSEGAAGVPQVQHVEPTAWWKPYVTFKRRSPAPWSQVPIEIFRPFTMFTKLPVFLPTLAYSILFSYTNVLLTVEIPALLGRKAKLNSQQTGLQFIGAILGAFLGELIAGKGSDLWMVWRTKKAGGEREPEFRLPFALPGFLLGAVGIIVFGVQLQNMEAGHWNVTPIVGVAIAVFGLQLVTTTTYAYANESQPPHLVGRVAPFISLVRQIYAFTAPFYLSIPFEEWGDAKAGGMYAALAGGIGLLCTAACLTWGRKWRKAGLSSA